MKKLYDKKKREIHIGDIVKVYHFTGARRKRYYMYKQVLNIDDQYMWFSHLNMAVDDDYPMFLNDDVLADHEIVQSIKCDKDDRPVKC